MGYRKLYNFCQDQEIHIGRNVILEKIREISGKELQWFRRGMDLRLVRGLFIAFPEDNNHSIRQQFGRNVIAVGRGQNRCWERLIIVKEALHALGDDEEAASSPEKLETLLNELNTPGGAPSPQMQSEFNCLFLALAMLCPEQYRLQFQAEIRDNRTDYQTVATRLRIPQAYVPTLFSPTFELVVQAALSK